MHVDYQIERLINSFQYCIHWAKIKDPDPPDGIIALEALYIEYKFQQGVFYGLNWTRSLCDK